MRGLKIFASAQIIACAAAGLLFANPAVAKAAPLTAAEQQYVSDLETLGISALDGNDSELVKGGYAICNMLSAGDTKSGVIATILTGEHSMPSDVQLTLDDVRGEVDAAVNDLCPKSEGA